MVTKDFIPFFATVTYDKEVKFMESYHDYGILDTISLEIPQNEDFRDNKLEKNELHELNGVQFLLKKIPPNLSNFPPNLDP